MLKINNTEMKKHRDILYNWLRSCLFGPGFEVDYESEKHDLVGVKPLERFHVGILFPIKINLIDVDSATDFEAEKPELNDTENDDIQVVSSRIVPRFVPPSSAGFSFFIEGEDIRFQIVPWCAKYLYQNSERDEFGHFTKEVWKRTPCILSNASTLDDIRPPVKGAVVNQRFSILDGLAEVGILWRQHSKGWLVTISISNRQTMPEETDSYQEDRNKLSLFETHLECIINSGEVGSYPDVNPNLLDQEEQELFLQYKNKIIYAVGHGASVDWLVNNGLVKSIQINFLPKVEVPQVSVSIEGQSSDVLSLPCLEKFFENADSLFDNLNEFVNGYERWVDQQRAESQKLSEFEKNVADRIISRMYRAVSRMKSGVRLLVNDKAAARSFGIANKAMLLQMRQADKVQGKIQNSYKWRPFQLAFLLTVIESVVNEDSEFRDTLDLIWFPTGGGKTEAYLGLIAFIIAFRRIKNPVTGGGTTIIMRYSLRLLTQQQFERGCRLIFAMEILRREHPLLGSEPISIGMWVGKARSPNRYEEAVEIVSEACKGNTEILQRLVVDRCPWCQTKFRPQENYDSSPKNFSFFCKNPKCEFGHTNKKIGVALPCNVIDEALYEEPPTLLLATIDKFARLAWEERATVFFGKNGNRPPELVIQDELHLISGSLGSIAGLYEAALDTILQNRGVYPKYIASTATIRMARKQVQRLYGRSLAVFPPPGVSSEDSYFAKTVPTDEKPGRLYVGYLAYNQSRSQAVAPLTAALLSAPHQLFSHQEDAERLMDAWWTLVIYHGSLKGVSNSDVVLKYSVPDYVARHLVESANQDIDQHRVNALIIERLKHGTDKVAQLTSLSSAEENAATFNRLEKRFNDPLSLDVVLATNMVSVGLDVSRLALMVINGQPLTTSEYIQASSRVGRGEVPGFVVVNFFRDQARSLSHFESFRAYHESFYRFVEPTSLTPYTRQARNRALHAALVIAIRHSCSWLTNNNDAFRFDKKNPDVVRVLESLKNRIRLAANGNALSAEEHLFSLVDDWEARVELCRKKKRQLNYQAPNNDGAHDRLLFNHDDKIEGLWSTLQSMRNVEKTTLFKIL